MTKSSKNNDINYFKELPFYNVPLEKPKIKRLKNIDLFYYLNYLFTVN